MSCINNKSFSSRLDNREKKLALLHFIKEKKEVLFAAFSGSLNNAEKEGAWQEVADQAKSLGLAGIDRHWTFVRDSLFGVWKSRALVGININLCINVLILKNILTEGSTIKQLKRLDS